MEKRDLWRYNDLPDPEIDVGYRETREDRAIYTIIEVEIRIGFQAKGIFQ